MAVEYHTEWHSGAIQTPFTSTLPARDTVLVTRALNLGDTLQRVIVDIQVTIRAHESGAFGASPGWWSDVWPLAALWCSRDGFTDPSIVPDPFEPSADEPFLLSAVLHPYVASTPQAGAGRTTSVNWRCEGGPLQTRAQRRARGEVTPTLFVKVLLAQFSASSAAGLTWDYSVRSAGQAIWLQH